MSQNLSNIINFETFREEGTEWKRFGKTLFFLLGAPLLLLVAVLEIAGWRLGETVPFPRAAQMQAESPDLIWNAGRQENYAYFKLARVARERPDVLVIGDSRSGQFRSVMFRPYSCYNLSRVSWPIETLTDLLRHLPAGYAPKVIVLNLDFMMFNPSYTGFSTNATPVFGPPNHFHALWDIFRELWANPALICASSQGHFPGETLMGLSAHVSEGGFRKDGSEMWAVWRIKDFGRDPEAMKALEPKFVLFSHGDAMGTREKAKFEEFISLAHSMGSTVIGIQMPIYGPVVRTIEQDPKCGILNDFRAHVAGGYFDRLGVIFFDALTFPPYSEDYRYFITSVHPTEAVSSAILLKLASDPRVKAVLPKLDTAALQQKLDEDTRADQHVFLYNADH
jgi:hypothetical protein